jgi:glycosyltransferase involved in cell wall biosynthesis
VVVPSGSDHTSAIVLLPHRGLRNIYVRELGRAYQSLGVQPLYGPENLFDSDLAPDLLHLHWPEEVYRSPQEGSLDERIDRFHGRLDRLRGAGTRIIWSVHNLNPHETPSPTTAHRAYQGVVDRAHVIHHHCPASEALLRAHYRVPEGQAHFVAPHGHYLAYRHDMTRSQARAELGMDDSRFVFLHFGQIRDYKGLNIVENAFREVRGSRKHLIVAGSVSLSLSPAARIRFRTRRTLARRTTYVFTSIRNDDVQRYFLACDAVVLGHTGGLNSGVAVLAMTFGKPVIGPRLGCIEWVLAQGSNLIYESARASEIARAMEAAAQLDPDAVGARNRSVAAGWSWETIASQVVALTARGPADRSRG